MAHVYEGTPEQNCFDKIADDTNEHGIRNGCHVLVDQQVIEIREKYATGLFSQNELAREYGVRQSQIWKIIRRRNWKHL
jgi:DNA invertase Pin-like site-specific DNA recombinase